MEERLPVNRPPLNQESIGPNGPKPVTGAAAQAEARPRSDPAPAASSSATIEPVSPPSANADAEPTPVEIEQDKPIQVESIVNPTDIRSVALTGLFLMALLYTLHFTREVALPITIALLFNFLLRPIIQKLEKFRIPPSVSAALVMILLIAALGGLAYGLAQPARAWLQRAPAMMGEVGEKMQKLRQPVENVTKVAEKVGQIAQGGGAAAGGADQVGPGAPGAPATPAAAEPQTVEVKRSLLDNALVAGLVSSTQTFVAEVVVVVILLYFLLASGDFFLRKMIRVMPTLSDKKRALRIAMDMQHEMSHYFLTVTLINAGLGVSLSIGLWLVGLPNPVLWGALGGLMNFIPYLGATVNITLTTFVALLSFDTVGQALLVPAVYVFINSIEGSVVTPWILGRQFTLNPVVIFIWLIFWGWMWGVPGALIAVPMLSALKIFCDHIESLSTLGEFLGNSFEEKNGSSPPAPAPAAAATGAAST